MQRGWKAHESYVARLLGLDQTSASGSQWHDPGDSVDRSHPSLNDFALVVDCKCTGTASYSLKRQMLHDWCLKAHEMGKRFALPIRFEERERDSDYILLRLDDFAELLERAK